MPKATLEFNLPEEENEFTLACNAFRFYLVLEEISSDIRSLFKYNDESEISNETLKKKLKEIWGNAAEAINLTT